MFAKGAKEGFIVRFYDIATALLVFMLSFYLTPAFSNLITLHNSDNSPVYEFIGPFINQILIFLIILIILLVVRKLLGLLLKPVLSHLSETLRLTALINRFLGAMVGILEAYLISGLILTMIIVPFAKDGRTYREFDSCLHFFTNQIAQNVDYINAFEFFYCQIFEIICSNT